MRTSTRISSFIPIAVFFIGNVTVFLSVGGRVDAQTVQLPTQRVFSVGTSVMVPDRGSISLGGLSRAREASTRRGPLALNGGMGREFSHTDAAISAHIIDLDAMDKQVLAEARRTSVATGPTLTQQRALYLTTHMARSASAPGTLPARATPAPRPTATDRLFPRLVRTTP